MDPLTFLTYLSVILLLGIICTVLAQKLNVPNILLLLLAGLLAGRIPYGGGQLFQFPGVFLTSISILALVMIIFDSASRFKLKQFGDLSIQALKLSVIFLFFNLFLLTSTVVIIFKIDSILLGLLFAALMSGTDPGAMLTMFKGTKNRTLQILEVESLINTPLVVLLPFLILDLMDKLSGQTMNINQFFTQVFNFLPDFLLRFVAGIGAGILVGLIVFRIMKKQYSETLSPLAIITAALLTYILAENLGGNGVLAVTTMGLFYGAVYVKEKAHLLEFSSLFANSFEILVFVLVGLIIKIPLTFDFFIKSFGLFVIYLLIRLSSIHLAFYNSEYTLKEKLYMALNVQKGIAVAVVAFTLTTLTIPGIGIVLDVVLAFMLYSIILSTVLIKVSRFFFAEKVIK